MDKSALESGFTDGVFRPCSDCGRVFALVFTFVMMLQTHTALANWVLLSMSSVGLNHDTGQCSLVDGLVLEQMRICEQNPEAMPCVGTGVGMGLSECKWQFAYERWNCSTANSAGGYAPVLNTGTRETAFAYAVTSAGVVHTVTAACSAGNLTECTCDMSRHGLETKEGWRWGGCSDNVDYGVYFARTFIDAPERVKRSLNPKDAIALMNLHNNEVGRRTVADGLTRKCRCHGVSGSCAVKTCWSTISNFRETGDLLKAKYSTSIELSPRDIRKLAQQQQQTRSSRQRRKAISDQALVYVKDSPNYCKRSRKKGIAGTKGRECKTDTYGPESCHSLCCGRGYRTREEVVLERCHCKFVWCCEVVCKVCETKTLVHTCK